MSSEELKPCLKSALRAMAINYAKVRAHCWDHLDSETCNMAADKIAALEAENARLVEDVKKWQALAQNVETLERITESAEARRAQLAAIQGGMGEVVEVVAWRIEHPVSQWKVYEQRQDWAYQQYGHIKYQVQDLMTVAQHQRISAAMAAEVQTWKQLHADAQELYADAMIAIGKELGIDVSDEPRCKHVSAQAMAMAAEVERLKAEVTRWHTLACNHSRAEDQLRAELAEVKGRLGQNAARYEWLRDHYHGFEHYRKSTGTVANLDREIDEQIAALSTWRQAHTPSTLPASSAEE